MIQHSRVGAAGAWGSVRATAKACLLVGVSSVVAMLCLPLSTGPAMAKGDGTNLSLLPGGNSKEPVNIEADRLEYWNKDQKAVYIGNVVVVQGETSMNCSKLTIFINREDKKGQPKQPKPAATGGAAPGGDSVRHMDAEGPVKLVSKDQIGTGDRLEYDKPTNKVSIIGHVVLTQGTNVTKGDLLTYDLETGVAHVESGASAGRVSGYFVPGSGTPHKADGKADPEPHDTAKPKKKGSRGAGHTASRQKRTE